MTEKLSPGFIQIFGGFKCQQLIFITARRDQRFVPEIDLERGNFREFEIIENRDILGSINNLFFFCGMDHFYRRQE